MSDNLKKGISIVVIVVALILSCIVLIKNRNYKKDNTIKDNQVIYKNVKYVDVANTYLTEFTTNMFLNIKEAYKMLDDNYKKELGGFENFEQLVHDFEESNNYSIEIESFSMKEKNGYKYFYLKDNYDNVYIFKEKAIMDYTVYLSESSVE